MRLQSARLCALFVFVLLPWVSDSWYMLGHNVLHRVGWCSGALLKCPLNNMFPPPQWLHDHGPYGCGMPLWSGAMIGCNGLCPQAAATGEAVMDEAVASLAQRDTQRFHRLSARLQVSLGFGFGATGLGLKS